MSDITVAVSGDTLAELFAKLISIFRFDVSGSTNGSVRFSARAAGHLQGGAFSLVPPDPHNPIFAGGFFKISGLGLAWDMLQFGIAVDIPPIHIGGDCILDSPWGCVIRLPEATFFGANPDVSASIDIGGSLQSRLSLGIAPETARLWNGDDQTYQWNVLPRIVWSNLDLVDIAATIGNLIDRLIQELIDNVFSFLPDWARDLIDAILGGIADFIRRILSIPNDVQDWLSNLLRTSIDIFDLIIQAAVNYFQTDLSLYSIDDPMELLAGEPGLPPVSLGIANVSISVDASEVVLEVLAS